MIAIFTTKRKGGHGVGSWGINRLKCRSNPKNYGYEPKDHVASPSCLLDNSVSKHLLFRSQTECDPFVFVLGATYGNLADVGQGRTWSFQAKVEPTVGVRDKTVQFYPGNRFPLRSSVKPLSVRWLSTQKWLKRILRIDALCISNFSIVIAT